MTARPADARLAAVGVEEAVPFHVPTATRFRGVTHRDGWLLRGPGGWAEFSPFPEYPPEVAARWLAAAVEAATVPPPSARRDTVEVNVTVPAVGPAEAAERVRAAGCRTAKVKVAEPGQGLAADLDRVAAVRDALGPDAHIRIDANAAWDVPTATHAIDRLEVAAGGLEYAEQPCRTLTELAEVRRRTGVAVAADESLRTSGDLVATAHVLAASVDVVILKVQPLGGVGAALAIAEASGLPAVVSSALETSIGLAVGLDLARALPGLDRACGLGTAELLAEDVVAEPLRPHAGRLAAAVRPVPDRARAVTPEVRHALERRLAGALDVLVGPAASSDA